MAKPELKIEARRLRRKGLSLCEIMNELGVCKNSVISWCRDINLTEDQIKRLDEKCKDGLFRGRLKGAKINKQKRLDKIRDYKKEGEEYYSNLSDREFMTAGLALYLGEGSKKNGRFGFSNSDPRIMKFIKVWAKECLGVKEEDFTYRVRINYLHKDREDDVLQFWQNVLDAPIDSFYKTTYIKTRNKKDYENFENHYGTLTIRVRKSSNIFYKISGFSEGLLNSKLD